MLSYSATLETGNVVHTESTLPGTGPDVKLCMWPVMSELPAVLPHPEVTSKTEAGKFTLAIFGSGPRDDSAKFCEEISGKRLAQAEPKRQLSQSTLSAYRSTAEDRRHTLCYHPGL